MGDNKRIEFVNMCNDFVKKNGLSGEFAFNPVNGEVCFIKGGIIAASIDV